MWGRNQRNRNELVGGVSVLICLMFMLTCVPESAASGSGWMGATLIETDNTGSVLAKSQRVGVDAAGNAIAVWQQQFQIGSFYYTGIWANRYMPGFGWGDAEWITGTYGASSSEGIDLAVSPDGHAMVVWTESAYLWSSVYTPNIGWSKAKRADNLPGFSEKPRVAIDDENNAVIVWKYGSGTTMTDVYANWAFNCVVDPTKREVVDVLSSAGNIEVDSDVAVAVGGVRNATVVWSQYILASDKFNIYANRYTNGDWGAQVSIEWDDSGQAKYPNVAMDKNNNAIAVWSQEIGGDTSIYSNVYNATTSSWYAQPPGHGVDLLESQTASIADYPKVEVDSNGNAIAVWQQTTTEPVSHRDVRANHYVKGVGWDPSKAINLNIYANESQRPDIGMDAAGNAVVVWSQEWYQKCDVCARVFVVGNGWPGGWKAPGFIEDHRNAAISDIQYPRAAMNTGGSAMAVWRDFDAFRYNTYANGFVLPDLIPPSLSLTSPINGLVTTIPVVTVAGTVEANAMLVVNGIYASTSGGAFSVNIALQVGDNTIAVTATDAAGNSASITRTVRFNDPIPALQAQVTQTISDLVTVWSKLNYTNATAGTIWDQLNATKTSLTALQTQVTDLQAQVTALGSDLTDLQALVNAQGSDITDLQNQANALESDLTALQDQVSAQGSDLTALQDQVTAMDSELTPLQSQVSALEGQMTTLQARVSAMRSQLIAAYSGVNATDDQVTAALSDITALENALDAALSDIDALQTALSDVTALQAQLNAVHGQLTTTRASLNTTQDDLSAVQTDLQATQDDVNDKASSSSPMMWAIIAIVVSVIASVALSVVLRKKT